MVPLCFAPGAERLFHPLLKMTRLIFLRLSYGNVDFQKLWNRPGKYSQATRKVIHPVTRDKMKLIMAGILILAIQ